MDYEPPTPAEYEPPSADDVKRAIASQGPAPVAAADFLVGIDLIDLIDNDYPF